MSKNTITADVPVSASLETESGPATSSSGVSNRALEGVFIVAVFLSSTLLFMVQPLVARLLLPLAGGSSALWNTAMVFFQITLLLGYAYAHGSLRKVGARKHPFLHAPLLVVPFLVLPLAVPEGWTLPNDVAPSLWVLGVLALIVGLPFFALATTSPTLQVWFSSTDHPRAADPYFLYAAGNVGSVLALLGYPLVMEPMLSLKAQTRFWAIGYGLFVIACIAAGFLTRTRTAPTQNVVAEQLAPLTNARRLRWTFWGFVPSALMIGVTLHITTDLASFPLLWVVPLLLYLVTFIIAFGKDSLTRSKRAAVAVLVLAIPLAISGLAPSRWALYIIGLHLGFFFFAALLCHSRLADDRPPAGQLTEFFLILSIGGALGGIFASLLAPLVFDTVIEYPITIVLALLIAWQPTRSALTGPYHPLFIAAIVGALLVFVFVPSKMFEAGMALAVLALCSYGRRAGLALLLGMVLVFPSIPNTDSSVTLDRSFFGVYRVDETVQSDNPVRWIVSGTTVHGGQFLENDDGFDGPISYYSPLGPVGRVMESAQPQKVGVIGLGAGGMAGYGRPGDHYTFWEIDQLVVDIAEDPELFTFLSDSPADIEVLVDDGRHGVAISEGGFDLIMVDAFGSDAIPVHLITADAIELYLDKLAPNGTLMIHISNRHFNLRPVVGATAAEAGTQAYIYDFSPAADLRPAGAVPATWTAMTRADAEPAAWLESGLFTPLPTNDVTPWSDDYSNVIGAIDW